MEYFSVLAMRELKAILPDDLHVRPSVGPGALGSDRIWSPNMSLCEVAREKTQYTSSGLRNNPLLLLLLLGEASGNEWTASR